MMKNAFYQWKLKDKHQQLLSFGIQIENLEKFKVIKRANL